MTVNSSRVCRSEKRLACSLVMISSTTAFRHHSNSFIPVFHVSAVSSAVIEVHRWLKVTHMTRLCCFNHEKMISAIKRALTFTICSSWPMFEQDGSQLCWLSLSWTPAGSAALHLHTPTNGPGNNVHITAALSDSHLNETKSWLGDAQILPERRSGFTAQTLRAFPRLTREKSLFI